MKLASIFFTASAVNLQSLCILCSYVQNHKKILRFAQNDRLREFVIHSEAKNLKIILLSPAYYFTKTFLPPTM